MKLLTIGFTKKSAESFFGKLQRADTRRLADVRLNNVSQLAGFAKRDDLKYFLKAICNIDYVHIPDRAPTQEMLDAFKKHRAADWSWYEREFLGLMRTRGIENTVYRRFRTKLGAPKATTAMAHKLARLVYRLLKYSHQYIDKGAVYYAERHRQQQIVLLSKKATRSDSRSCLQPHKPSVPRGSFWRE